MIFRLFFFSFFLFSTALFSASPSFLRTRDQCGVKGTGIGKSDLLYLIQNDKSFNINDKDENGITLLMQCTGGGRTDTVNVLLENGAFVDAQNNGQTALFSAATFGKTDIVWRLLKAGANKNLKDKFGLTAADYANRSGNYKIVEMLGGKPQNLFIDEKRKAAYEIMAKAQKGEISVAEFERQFAPYGPLIDEPAADGQTFLHYCAYYQKNDMLEAAIRLKANVNIPNPVGTTPLMFAALAKNTQGIIDLVEAGADLNLKNNDGKTASDFGEDKAKVYLTEISQIREAQNIKTQKEIVNYLKKKEPSKLKAMIRSHEDKIKEMNKEILAAEAQAKKPQPSSPKPQVAPAYPIGKMIIDAFNFIEQGNVKGFISLLDKGLPVDARDANGNPMIIRLCVLGNPPMITALVGRGANINIKGVNGNTPLMVATVNYKYDLVAYLVKIGAEKAIRNNFNWTAFDFARQNRDDRLMFMTRF